MDKLTSIKVFLLVARLGSFSAAAAELGMSKASASKHVSQLESELGIRLLNRTTRRLSLTEVGRAYRERMREILDEIEETEQAVGELSSEPRGTLRILAPTSFGSFHLARAITDYRRAYPKVGFDLVLTDRAPDIVEEGLDLVIHVGELQPSSLVARKLTQVRVVVCAAPEYLAGHGMPQTLADLAQHNCLIYTARQPTGEWGFSVNGSVRSIRIDGDIRSNLGDSIRIAALQACGLAQLPTYMVGLDVKGGWLKVVLENWEPPPRPVYAVYLHRRHLSAKVRTFVDFLWQRFQPEPYWERWTD